LVIFILGAIISFMIFFPLVIAPTIFKNLDEKQAKLVLRSFFPKYYLYGIVLTVIGLIFSSHQDDLILIISFLFLLMSFIFLRQYLTPVINNAKDNITDDVKNELKFKRLHLLSVVINFFQIIFSIVLLLNILIFKFTI
tara:strand:- start:176 stop:592 length:417 start_codon:yes stop_codon:yes gene_type:complete